MGSPQGLPVWTYWVILPSHRVNGCRDYSYRLSEGLAELGDLTGLMGYREVKCMYRD